MAKLRSRRTVLALALLAALAGSQRAAADDATTAGLHKTLAIAEARTGRLSPQLLPLLDRLAGAQFDDGALADAAESRRRALRIALAAYGPGSLDVAQAMVALAELRVLERQYGDAEPLLIAALPVLEARLGADSPALAHPLASLARIALAQGDLAAAESWARRAAALAARRPAAESGEALRVLAAICAEERRFDEGERLLRAALDRDRRSGPASLGAARSLAGLGALLLRAGRLAEALPAVEQAIAIDQQRLAPAHPLIADDFADLGLIYAGLGRDVDAAAVLGYAVELLNRGRAHDTSRLAYAELELAPVLRRLGEGDAAQAFFKDAKRILDAVADDDRQRERRI